MIWRALVLARQQPDNQLKILPNLLRLKRASPFIAAMRVLPERRGAYRSRAPSARFPPSIRNSEPRKTLFPETLRQYHQLLQFGLEIVVVAHVDDSVLPVPNTGRKMSTRVLLNPNIEDVMIRSSTSFQRLSERSLDSIPLR